MIGSLSNLSLHKIKYLFVHNGPIQNVTNSRTRETEYEGTLLKCQAIRCVAITQII